MAGKIVRAESGYRIDYQGPKFYRSELPIFGENNVITERVTTGLENVMSAYADWAIVHAQRTNNNPANYQVQIIKVVGSGARENKVDSDLDLLLEAPHLGTYDAVNATLYLNRLFFAHRSKREAIDPYVEVKDVPMGRPRIDITSQVRKIVGAYNSKLKKASLR